MKKDLEEYKVQHAELELKAKVSSYIAKGELTVPQAIEVLHRIAESWDSVNLALEAIKNES